MTVNTAKTNGYVTGGTDADFSGSNDDWETNFSELDTGTKYVYIRICIGKWNSNGTKITTTYTDSSTYTITFHQKQVKYYKTRFLIFQNVGGNSKGQADMTFVSEKKTFKATATVKAAADTFNITIKKIDSGTGDVISGIGFTIYNNTTKKYINADGKETSSYTAIQTGTNGLISITGITPSNEDGDEIIVTEVSGNDYYINDSTTKTETCSEGETYTFTFRDNPITLKITKYEEDGETAMEGVGFKITYEAGSSGTWLYDKENGRVAYGVDSKAEEYYTDSAGEILLTGLKKGTYTIYETSIPSEYEDEYYYLEWQSGYDSTYEWVNCGTVSVSGDTTTSYEKTITNIIPKGSLQINKTGYDESTGLPARFALLYYNSHTGKYNWVSGAASSSVLKTYTEVSSSNYSSAATIYQTSSSGTVTINKLLIGTYYLYETSTYTAGYYLEDQTDIGTAPDVTVNSDWRYCGSYTVTKDTTTPTSNIVNTTGGLQITKYDDEGTNKLNGYKFVFVWSEGIEDENSINLTYRDETSFILTLSNAQAHNYTWYSSKDDDTYTEIPGLRTGLRILCIRKHLLIIQHNKEMGWILHLLCSRWNTVRKSIYIL